jgi:hypothetical protein
LPSTVTLRNRKPVFISTSFIDAVSGTAPVSSDAQEASIRTGSIKRERIGFSGKGFV